MAQKKKYPIDFDAFRRDFNKAVEALQSKYNVNIEMGGISYSSTDFTTKLTVVFGTTSKHDAELVQYKKNFELNSFMFPTGLEVGSPLHFSGATKGSKDVTFAGLLSNRRNACCAVLDPSGKIFTCSQDTLKRVFAKSA